MNAKMIRSLARDHLRDRWVNAILVAAVASLLGGLIGGASFLPNIQRTVYESSRGGSVSVGAGGSLLGIIAFIMGGTAEVGYARFLLKVRNGQPAGVNEVISYFDHFGTGFIQHFLRMLYIVIGCICLIVPGVIMAFSYSMTPFVLAENPDMSARDAMAASKQLMNGHKMELFMLHLSFFGWMILAALTANLGYLALNPYIGVSNAEFYCQLTGGAQRVSYLDADGWSSAEG